MTTATDLIPLFHSRLFYSALIASLLSGTIFGALGPLMVWKRLGLMGDALSHASLTAAAVALIYGWPLTNVLIPFALVVSQLLAWVDEKKIFETDAVLAVFFAGFLALGVLIMSISGKGSEELVHLLLGDINSIENNDLLLLTLVLILVATYLIALRRQIVLIVFQPDLARVEGLPVSLHNFALMALVGLAVATGLKLLGVVLLTALMMVPPLVARAFGGSLRRQWILSILIGCGLAVSGLCIAFLFNLPSGPTIAGLALLVFFIAVLHSSLRKKIRRSAG